jgi:hypothetical protein
MPVSARGSTFEKERQRIPMQLDHHPPPFSLTARISTSNDLTVV